MIESQLISKFSNANFIRKDPTALSIIFYIFHHQGSKISEIMNDLNLTNDDTIKKLEYGKFIEENPHPEEDDKIFILSVGGQLLIKEILRKDPSVIEELYKD